MLVDCSVAEGLWLLGTEGVEEEEEETGIRVGIEEERVGTP